MRAPRRRRALATAAFAAAIALPALFAAPAPRADAGWWDDLDKGETVTLSDLCAEPVRWRDKVVTFACIYHEPAEIYSPYFTSFNAEQYWNVTAWFDGSPLWELEAFQKDDFPFLYLPRNHAQRAELFAFQPYTRIEITGKVKDVYRSRPWIEIQAVRATAATLGKAVVDYVKSGDGYTAQGNYASAEAHYRRALAEISLADVYRMRIEKRLAAVLRAAGKGLEANRLEGDTPVLGGSEPPVPGATGTGLPDARAPAAQAPAAAPPGALTEDLPGEAMGATLPRRPEPSVAVPPTPSGACPPRGPEPALRPVTRPMPGSVRPPSELTDDLPGTPADQGPPPSAPPARDAYRPPTMKAPPAVAADPSAPAAPPLSPPTPPAPPQLPPPASTVTPPASPPAPAAPAAPAAPVAPATASAVPPPEPPPAPAAPPPPPPRQPRLSGVR